MAQTEFPIVGIGASAGGIEAFRVFFQHMPPDCGMAFVMVLHLPAGRKSMLPEILSRWTSMRVREGTNGTPLEPNCVYVPPPNASVTIADGRLMMRMAREDSKVARPIDGFFDALASSLGEQAVGIVLSGTGSDGALGLKAIKAAGGLTLVQGNGGTAPQYGEMPAGAIATGSVDVVASVEELPAHLLRMKASRTPATDADAPASSMDVSRLEICDILRAQLGHDFSGYRDGAFLRRVQRRMQVLGVNSLEVYIARLRADRREAVTLFRDLLIQSRLSTSNRAPPFDSAARTLPRREPASPSISSGREASSSAVTGDSFASRPAVSGSSLMSRFKQFLRGRRSSALRHELTIAQAALHSLAQEHQTALEELRGTNEQLHSVNEELQSTNEELETSKEELQSLNEELHTVNMRLTEKVDELAATNSDLRNLFDCTEIATIFLDRHLIVRSFTPAIGTLYNLIPSDQGRPLTDIVSRLDYDHLREDVGHVLSTLEPLERRTGRVDGSAHYLMRILPYREPDSAVSGVLVTFLDVTSIVKAEAALLEADVRKDLFLATLSHELRNPLASIRTAARLLQSANLKPEQPAYAQAIIARQVTHMSSLLDDLLDVSRITRGAFLLKKSYVNLKDLLESAVEVAQPAIDAKRHTFRVDCPSDSVVLEVDPVRFTQVVSNLLTNAAKYTPPGGLITLGCSLESYGITLFVRDNGLGLAPEMLGRVFDMFTRVDSDAARSEGGLGIGLALAKGLVELHGGRIEARSAGLGEGSEFVISLPRSLLADDRESSASRQDSGSSGPPKKVLIADDNRDGAETLKMYMHLQGHEIHVAYTGAEALAVAAAVRPEVGVIDIGLPDVNGYEIAERIRHEAWGDRVTLIALTGWGQEDDKRRARAAGFDHHCTKPIDPAELERLFSNAHVPGPAPGP